MIDRLVGSRLVATLIRLLPFGDVRERQLLAKFAEVSLATIKGTLVIGIVQGAIGAVLFWALGISAPVFWGTLMGDVRARVCGANHPAW